MDSSPLVRTIETPTHGRYLVHVPRAGAMAPLLVGFHGYAEDAERHLSLLQQIPGADAWLLVAVQALHPFYTRDDRIVANWMTRQDRELAIADNIRYVGAVVHQVRLDHGAGSPLVFAGFSQGGAMAYRAAAHYDADGVIVLGADVPPDVGAGTRPLPRVLLGRGLRDTAYTEARMREDLATLARLQVPVETCVFEGGHEWTPAFMDACGAALVRAARRA
jgi:predicted esterase